MIVAVVRYSSSSFALSCFSRNPLRPNRYGVSKPRKQTVFAMSPQYAQDRYVILLSHQLASRPPNSGIAKLTNCQGSTLNTTARNSRPASVLPTCNYHGQHTQAPNSWSAKKRHIVQPQAHFRLVQNPKILLTALRFEPQGLRTV